MAVQQQINSSTLAQAPVPHEDQERKRRMTEAWKAYRGEFQRPLKVKANQTDDNVISNRCAPIVDKGVSFLFGQVLKIEATNEATNGDKSASKPTPIQDFLDGLWGDDDDRMTLLSNLAINGGVCGQVFVRLIPAQGQMKYPRVVVLNPQLIRIVTHPDDLGLVIAYIIEYPGEADFQKRQIIARIDPDNLASIAGEYDLDDTWTITNYLRRGMIGSWLQVGEPEVWPYPFAPIASCQNMPNPNESWGKPDLTPDIIDQNKVLNFVQSNVSRVLKFHAHPKTVVTGTTATQVQIGIDELIFLPTDNSKITNVEMQSDLHSSLNFAAVLRDDMDEQSRVPAVALGRVEAVPKGNVSGVALQLLFQPLIEKTTQKQRLYGCLIREISRAALVLSETIGLDEYENYPIGLHFQNLLPVDDLSAAQTAQILKTLGVSDSTILSQLGYNSDDEAEKSATEDSKKMVLYSRGQGFPPALPQQQPIQQPNQVPQPAAGGPQQ